MSIDMKQNGVRPPSFRWEVGLTRLCQRLPDLTQQSDFQQLLAQQDAVDPSVSAEVLARYLLQPLATLAVADCFRPVLLEILSCLLDKQDEYTATNAVRYYIAVEQILEVAPHLERIMLPYFTGSQTVLQQLSPLDEPELAILMARAVWRSLQLLPALKTCWSCSVLYSIMLHKVPEVRWYAVHCVAITTKLDDDSRQQLLLQVLTKAEQMQCFTQERKRSLHIKVQQAAMWLPNVTQPHQVPEGQQQRQQDRPLQRTISGSDNARQRTGYVNVCGIALPCKTLDASSILEAPAGQSLIYTAAVEDNLKAAALALCQTRPLLLEGPPGCGKTALVEELARLTGNMDMVRVHVDDQMDSKSLLGAYVCTSNPEEFVWQPGPLTQAVAQGKWLVIEDLNLAPPEVLAALVPLLGSRQLHLPQRAQVINAAPGFQLLASITTAPGAGSAGAYGSSQAVKEVLGSLLSAVTVAPPTDQEQLLIIQGLFPDLACLLPCAMAVLHLVRRAAGQLTQQQSISEEGGVEWVVSSALAAGGVKRGDVGLHVGRHYSIRDLITWCNRMQGIHGQLLMRSLRGLQNAEYSLDASMLPIAVREAAFVEAADCFAALIAKPEARLSLLRALAAVWRVGEEQVQLYTALSKPSLHTSQTEATIGRATLPMLSTHSKQPGLTSAPNSNKGSGSSFAQTGHAMRLLEGVGVALQQQEPALLVGETGTGKTTLVQRLADQVGAKLVVLNLSQQTDSSDLVGGFKPVEPRDALLPLLDTFQRLVRLTWIKGNNEDFLGRVTKYAQRQKWSSLLKAFQTAVQKVQKMHEAQETSASEERSAKRRKTSPEVPAAKKKLASKSTWDAWQRFGSDVSAAEKASMMAEKGFAFAFVEGALVKAVREGWWLLLDEINLAPAEALERIAGLLEGSSGSVTIAERGDMVGVPRHPNFRLLAAMNPATDAGKRDLPAPLRNRFTEIWVAEPTGREDLCTLVLAYLQGTVPHPPVDKAVNFYQAAKTAADSGRLQDGAHQKPSYSLRTLCRALEYCRTALPLYGMQRALLDGLKMAFMTQLDPECAHIIRNLINVHVTGSAKPVKMLERAPAAPSGSSYVLFEQFWLEKGPGPAPEAATTDGQGGHFVMTGSVKSHLHNLARAALIGRYPILLQGPTSSGKTSLVAYLAAQTGHKLVRINNHEQTDLQEYLGSYISNETGKLVFSEGALVQAVRQGHWLLLDELNLAPSQVLEALNRLLDDNRQLFVPELQETINPHPHFMLFATQNPPGQYGGRKVLSRAFRSRFLELHVGDLPDDELEFILQQRCALAPSYSKKLVGVMRDLYRTRQVSNVFAGKHGFITPRDLFKWAGRGAVGYPELAENGYLLLGERLRTPEDCAIVRQVLEKQMKVQLDMEGLYEREGSVPSQHLQAALTDEKKKASAHASGDSLTGVVWTPSMRRMYTLLDRCVQHSEPALLVGDTGTGKTTVCQMISLMRGQKLHIINCNQHTETSDFLGGFRPVRDRERSIAAFHAALHELQRSSLLPQCKIHVTAANDLAGSELMSVATDAVTAVGMIEKYMEVNASSHSWQAEHNRLRQLVGTMVEAAASARAPFEWADGPLVTAMRQGHIILIDELNLAEDAVLERLNSVLEPGRTLTLAEKGGAGAEVITAAPGFRLVGTMNPGGDYGKKELSPALSNRFTQIWVPAIQDQAELAAIIQSRITDSAVRQAIADRLLDFWTFYKANAGSARNGMSVRDLLAWVRFINAAAPHIGTEAAYAHGSHLVLLDGIGLGVGMPLQVAQALREKCQRYLAGQLPNNQADVAQAAGIVPAGQHNVVDGQNNVADGLWGIPPFFVERGPQPTPPNAAPFDFRAPTTASNALRVLRALQLKKAVLLEGSPGVGKTSLVAALATAVGQKLVRINLSEQTDMMDLLGADLPVEGGAPGQFAWCDGPLLAAIKAGQWVLLDELNLAGQSVLEGLNAVLDHRAEVFIPELGQTFQCPPSFHLFAAQNPLQEGGGRKGLPKSFLNRFSRVHIQLLLSKDLLFIAGSLHPCIPADCLANMVSFLKALHEGANTLRSFASAGGPWEFNLRDLLRWCNLAEAAVPAHDTTAALEIQAAVEHFSQMLFFERLRTPQDRQHLLQLYQQCWGHPLPLTPTPELTICPAFVKLGWATLPRTYSRADSIQHAAQSGLATAPYTPAKASPSTEPGQCLQLLPSQQAVLESVLQGVAMGWMSILVGGPGVGKTSLVRTAAQLAGRKLTEIALTGGTDTADLLGGFEQLEPKRKVQELAEAVQGLVDAATHQVLTAGTAMPLLLPERLPLLASMANAWTAYTTLVTEDSAPSSSPDTGLEQEVRLLMTVVQQVQAVIDACLPHLQWAHQAQQLQQKLQGLQAAVASAEAGGGRFEWVDGALTRAVQAGEWLLLDSANLCNPTVLDRLNPMLEPGGQLYLNECGTVNGQPRVIQPHPGFRLFLALDPRNGEVSRAMRNRGIELFMLSDPHHSSLHASSPPLQMTLPQACASSSNTEANAAAADLALAELESVLSADGVPGWQAPACLAAAHLDLVQHATKAHRRAPGVHELRHLASLTHTLLDRGWGLCDALSTAWDQVYVRSENSRELKHAAQTALQHHCTCLLSPNSLDDSDMQVNPSPEPPHADPDPTPTNQTPPAHQLSLVKPCAWPFPVSASHFADSADTATLARDAALMESYAAQLAAFHLLQADHSVVCSAVQQQTLPSVHALLPADMLRGALAQGCVASRQQLGMHRHAEADARSLSQLRLMWQAAACFAELASETDRDLRFQWSESLASQMKEGLSALGPKLDTVVTAAHSVAEAVQQLVSHPVALQLLQAVQASQGAKAASEQGLITGASLEESDVLSEKLRLVWVCCSHAAVTAAVLAAPSAGSQASPRSILQESHWRHIRPQLKARMSSVHPAVDWLYLSMAATAAVEKACLQSSSALMWTTELHNQVAALQQWHRTLWAYTHGSLTPEADPACQGFAVEPVTFTWMRFSQTVSKLTAANPQLLQWPEVVHLQHIAQQMDQHLGLAAGLPPKPLMWRYAGHPAQPASLRLCAMQADLFQLLHLTRPGTGKGFQLGRPSALKVQQLVLILDQNRLQGSLGRALVATLCTDVQLRQTLLQGACFFTLAAGKAKYSKGSDTHSDRAEHHRRQLKGQEEQAEGILALVEGSVRKVVEQAAERARGSEENNNSLTFPDCRGLGTKPAMGQLPELLPAVLMTHQAFQQLQLQLLPFQELESLQNGISLMAQLTAWLVSLASTDALTAMRPPTALVEELRASVQAAVRSGAQGVLHSMPHQLLVWLLEAQDKDVHELSLQAASLVHEAWYSWHQALWHNRLAHTVPANGPLLLQGATRSRLAADVVSAAATPILYHQAKALQLQLLVRHMSRSSVQQASEAGAEGKSARAEWHSLAVLLAQAILAHLPSIPEQVMQHRIAAVVKQLLLLPSAGKVNDRPADLTSELIQLLCSSSHSTLKQLLQPLLLPCLDAIVAFGHGLSQAASDPATSFQHASAGQTAEAKEIQTRGSTWVMLGMLRLHLAAPPVGTDPVGKYALKKAHIERRLTDDVLPETEVRQQLQRLPGAPTQSSRLAALRSTAAELRQKAAEMEAKAVPRPDPPQYAPLWQNVQRFLVGLGSVERMTSLLNRLTLQQSDASAVQEAEGWQQNAASWSDALLQQHPLYRDVLQPVGLAVYEVRCGLSLMVHAAAKKAYQDLANSTLVDCLAFPSNLGQGTVCGSEPAEQLLSALARRGHSGQHKSDRAGDVAAYGARLHALRAALHAAVRSALVEGPAGEAAAQSEKLFRRLLTAWEDVKSAEEQRAAEEAEMFKTKTRKIASEEEVDELSYKQSFPDHFSAFADVAQLEDMPDLGDDSLMLQHAAAEETESGVTDAQASSNAAQQLLHGDILVDVVSLHARLYTTFASATHHTHEEDNTWQAAFKLSYELGCSVLCSTQALPPVHIDHVTRGSHLMRLTMQHQELFAAPTPVAGQGDAVNIQQACVEEAALLAGPVCSLKARLEQLLVEWPEHPVLVQLSAICDRLTGLSVQSPLKAALTGLELLLARAQVWEESAAKHVSLARELEAVAALATRWRKLELAAWRNLLNTTRSRHAAGAHRTWFHLYRLVLEQPPEAHAEEEGRQQIQQVAIAVEQFLQTSTVGEYEQRLNMVWSFRCHALVQCQIQSQNPQRWTAIAAALYNTYRYYKQFLALMQKAIADGLAELEKQLEDFVRLAKWEDRGYYAMKATTERNQRQLHRLTRRGEEALSQPAAAVLAAASKAMGFADLTDASDMAALGGAKGAQAGKSARESKRRQAQSATLEEVQHDNIRAWQSFCSTSLKMTPSKAASGLTYWQGQQAWQSKQGDLYQHRLPQLGGRMQQLLVEAAAAWVASTEGAMGIEEVAGEAAERALELRQVTDKGARLRKKKALNDLLKALGALGFTRRRAAVPAHDRTVHAWFTQISPQLNESPVLSSEAALTGVAPASLEAAHQQWGKADAYYYMGIARMQQLWEAAKTPHHDMSALEVESSVRYCEHLLFVQRSQRHTLSTLSQQFKQLQALCQVLTSFKHGCLAPQGGVPQRMQHQVAQLDRLLWLLADTSRLVGAVSRVEGNAAAKATLQAAATVLQQHRDQIHASRVNLANHLAAAIPVIHDHHSQPFVTAAAHDALCNSMELIRRLAEEAQTADQQHGYSGTAPGWKPALLALQAAALQSSDLGQAGTGTKPQEAAVTGSPDEARVGQQWQERVEAVVTNMLLWAQNIHSLDAEVPSETDGSTILLQSSQLESKMNSKRIETMCHQLSGLLGLLVQMQAIQEPTGAHVGNMLGMLSQVQPLVSGVAAAFRQLGLQYLTLHKAVAKLGYIATSLLSGVMQEGFCTATQSEETEAGEGAGTFKEHEGTGMGEGEGAKDVSDKIENEDQLQGAQQKGQEEQQEEKAEPEEQDESKGIEMEGDFEGSLHDMQADPDADDQEQEEEGEERMDQEMGDVGDEGDVVDEQLWGQDEDKPQQSKAEEKYEKDAPIQVKDSSKLEYQAGQEEEAGASKDKPKPEAQKQEQQQQNADQDNDKGDEGEEEGGVNEDIQDKYEESNFAPPTGPDQELELPEDMNLDDDGKVEEESGEDPAGADQHQDDQQQQQQQSGFQDQPDEQGSEPQDTESPAIDQNTNMEDDHDDEDGTEAAAAAAAAAEEQGTDEQQTDQNMEGDEFNEGGDGEDDPMEGPLGGHGADEAEELKQQPEAGPEGVAAPTAASTPAQAAGTSEGDKDAAEASVQSMPDQAHGPQQAQQGMQEGPQAPPQGQQSSFGMAEAGAGGAPMPSSGHDGGQQQSDSTEQKDSNPYRSLGDALQQWRSRLAVTGDSATPHQDTSEDAGIDNAPDAPPDQPPDASQGEYEYMAEGEGRAEDETQALAPATEDQAKSIEALDQSGMPDQDADDITAAEPEAEAPMDESAERLSAEQVLRSEAAGGQAPASIKQEKKKSDGQPDHKLSGPEGEAAAADVTDEAEVDRMRLDDSYVSAQMQRASLSDGTGNSLPDEDMVLAEGGLNAESAQQLRREVELRVKAASDGTLILDTSQQSIVYGQEVWGRCEALTAGLSSDLAEQLRLVLEPQLASKMAGEYRTGKRISMKRVIAYIASHFRKDKIWLRRTRPDKRKYQVVVAVDDSRSMGENGCGSFALEALTLICRAMARLEVGEMGVVSYGGSNSILPLHPLEKPFTDANGPGIMAQMKFDQDNTIADNPMVELLTSMQHMLEQARVRSMGVGGSQDLHQLVIIVADGRFHEKESLQRVVAEASSKKGVLYAFIVLDNPASSLLDMQTVSFANGKPVFNKYIDSFPFPFYVVLRDIAALPHTLANLLRQWFELGAS
ncbi:hypothetical protein WJX77_009058 [Trebouxia sp. C0004]